jgi:hypothetical protein
MRQMRRLVTILFAAVLASNGFAHAARAQPKQQPAVAMVQSRSQVTAATTAQAELAVPAHAAPTFPVFGVPIRLWAPVERPYEPSAYRDLAGQPEGSGSAVLTQGMNGQ